MRFLPSLLLFILSLLSSKTCDGVLYGSWCPTFQIDIQEELGSLDCGCKGAFNFRYLFGVMQSCDFMYEGIETEVDLYQFRLNAVTEVFGDLEYKNGKFGESQVRLHYKAKTPALFFGGVFNYELDRCEMAVFGEKCKSCTTEGEYPVPEFSFDCSNIVAPA
jgi:hypothetical protein